MLDGAIGTRVVQRARELLCETGFCRRHRVDDKAFSRRRKLRFDVVMLLLLQKTLKSLQLHLHEFFERFSGSALEAATAGALSQARAKLKHTAFIELNEVAVLETVYSEDSAVQLWGGHRLLAVDSSLLRLPGRAELFEHFGGQHPSNQNGSCGGCVPQARLSVLYDLLNEVGLDAHLGDFKQGELFLAQAHLPKVDSGDIILADRGYGSYLLMAQIRARGAHFVVRCQRRCFAQAQKLFATDEAGASVLVKLSVNRQQGLQAQAMNLASELGVRFVSVRLPTGELEVLVTSLLDEELYPTECFLDLYHERWGIESWYKVLKGHLDLENFSGLSVEAILQDIHAAVLLCNLQSVLVAPAHEHLQQTASGAQRHDRKPNKAVSFHALKSRIIDLLGGSQPVEQVLDELTKLFLANTVSVRPGRTPPRQPSLPLRSLHFQKRIRKIVF